MKPWTTHAGLLLLMLALLAGCAAKQPEATAPMAAAPPAVQALAAKPAPAAKATAKATAKAGSLDSDEALLADLATDQQAQAAPAIADPLEPVNRGIFRFNNDLYIHVLDPVARGYKTVVPWDIRLGVRNFFTNLGYPLRLVSSLLQLKFERAGVETTRFALNSTMGIFGLGDAAKDIFDLPAPPKEDLGKAMATWGLGYGCYVVIPVLGPSSLRDGVGYFSGAYLDPVWYLDIDFWEGMGIKSYDWLNTYSFVTGEYADLVAGAVDPYVAVRDFYVQYRNKELAK